MVDRIGSTPSIPGAPEGGLSLDETVQGSFQGEKVSLRSDAGSLLADAAEEITFSVSETVEKKIDKRKISKEKKIDRAALAELAVEKAKDMKKDALLKFSEHVRNVRPDGIQGILREAEKFFEDISHQYLALSFLKDLFDQEGEAEELRATVGASVEYLMQTRGPEIRAGLNVTEVALEFSEKGLGSTRDLRDFYRDTVLHYEGIRGTYESIVNNFGRDDLPSAVDYLIRAVGDDLHSKGPSVSSPELKVLLDDLYHLESLGNLYRNCSDLIDRANQSLHITISQSPQDLLQGLLALKDEKWLTENQVLKLVENAGIKELEAQIYFLTGAREIVRLIPLKLFSDEENRTVLLARMQQALDVLIEKEE